MEDKTKPVLRQLIKKGLFDYERGKVKVYHRLDTREPKEEIIKVIKGCCQAIFVDFQKSGDVLFEGKFQKKVGLFYKCISGENVQFKNCYAEMTISLTDFVNPLKDKYSKLEYIELYVRLLQKIGLICEISSITATKLCIVIDYSKIDWNEEALLKLSWQTIRNLHVDFCSHVPARFIELVELYPDKDLLVLLQVAYRLTPYEAITTSTTNYAVSNGNPVFNYIPSGSPSAWNILVQTLNPDLNVTNFREHLKNQLELTKALQLTPLTLGITFTREEYENQYNRLVESTTKTELWTNIEKSILKNKQLTKKQTPCLQTI